MGQVRFGNVIVVPGHNGGRFPFCNSLLIDDSTRVIVDPGAGQEPLTRIREQTTIDVVFKQLSGDNATAATTTIQLGDHAGRSATITVNPVGQIDF